MNRNQFIAFMDYPDKLSGSDSILLAELVKNFPYFQTAHLLYAKSLHNQHSIHYNNQLKITATYATDRKVLHYLITAKPEVASEILKSADAIEEKSEITGNGTTISEEIIEPKEIIIIEQTKIIETVENIQEETVEIVVEHSGSIEKIIEITENSTEQNQEFVEKNDSPNSSVVDITVAIIKNEIIPPDVTEKKKDIIGERKEEFIEKEGDSTFIPINVQEAEGIVVAENTEEIIFDELEKEYLAQAAISKIELDILNTALFAGNKNIVEQHATEQYEEQETVESNFILNTPVESEIDMNIGKVSTEKTETNFDTSQTHSFTEWLRFTSNAIETSQEEKESEGGKSENNAPLKTSSDLIDNFLREQPKMAKPKVEFYNPVNMAKQSVAEDITFVSETLAKIFMLQGNYIKALQAYENLRLKYPEKRLYFAAQIKNLRKLINQQNNK